MSEIIIYILLGILVGLLIGSWLIYTWANTRKHELEKKLIGQTAETQSHLNRKNELIRELEIERDRYLQRQDRITELTASLTKMSTDYSHLTERMKSKGLELNEMQEKFQSDFEVLTNKIMQRQTDQITEYNKEQLGQMLLPLRERLTDFEQKVNDTYQKEARERFHLKKEIEQLMQLNLSMSQDAQNLTRALKGDSKMQGNWGEMILVKVLENSGLREGEEFVTQESFEAEDGRKLRPDVILKLPEGKHIVVDSKVSLTAYEAFVQAEEDVEQSLFLKNHLTSVSQHVKDLSDKHYHQLKGINSPDFVLLFMPIEPAFSLALQAQADLFSKAWEKRIVIVSPTTLLACLRTISSIWKLEHQNSNAQEIARQGGQLYDKFVGFVTEMEKIGKHLEQAQQTHGDAMRKLKDGKGALTGRVEKLRELGVKNTKRL